MPTQKFLVREGGKTKQKSAIDTSAGAADAGKIVALGSDGRFPQSMMPVGVGAATQEVPASESLSAGVFVNLWSDSGTLKARLADNSNGRAADGYVLEAVAADASATVYPLDGTNSALSSLTPGAEYWLGTSGAVTTTPLDETSAGNANKVSQFLGKAKSATELITNDDGFVIL